MSRQIAPGTAHSAPARRLQTPHGEALELRICQGPLCEDDYGVILSEYNRLAKAEIAAPNFRRWVRQSPSGHALHAVLRNSEGRIVGHFCLFPFPMTVWGETVVAAKGEYLWVHERFRRHPIRGSESSCLPAAVPLVRELYRRARHEFGWDPILLSAPPEVSAIHALAGAKPMTFELYECLFVLRPLRACFGTPNLNWRDRLAMLAVGTAQRLVSVLYRIPRQGTELSPVPIAPETAPQVPGDEIAFARGRDFLEWRYPTGQFAPYGLAEWPHSYVIARRGSPGGFLRVCSTNIGSPDYPFRRLVTGLIAQARREGAIGVRWAVYRDGMPPREAVAAMRRAGFLCVRRRRRILFYSGREGTCQSSRWSMEDSLTSFEH